REPAIDLLIGHRSSEQRADAASPSGLSEYACCPERPARARGQAPDTGLHHREYSPRRLVALTLGGGTDQLLQEERVALRLGDNPRHRLRARPSTKHLPR